MGIDSITNVELFKKIEKLRVKHKINIQQMSITCGVSAASYISWRKGVIPEADREPVLRQTLRVLEEL